MASQKLQRKHVNALTLPCANPIARNVSVIETVRVRTENINRLITIENNFHILIIVTIHYLKGQFEFNIKTRA